MYMKAMIHYKKLGKGRNYKRGLLRTIRKFETVENAEIPIHVSTDRYSCVSLTSSRNFASDCVQKRTMVHVENVFFFSCDNARSF